MSVKPHSCAIEPIVRRPRVAANQIHDDASCAATFLGGDSRRGSTIFRVKASDAGQRRIERKRLSSSFTQQITR